MNENIKKNGITFGIISGLISVFITTTMYIISLELFTKWWIGILSILISLVLSILLMTKTKREVADDFSFKNAFTTYFIYTVIGISISVFFNILLFNVIDTEAKITIKEITMRFSVEIMEKFNTPKDKMNEAILQLENTDQFGVLEQIKGMFFTIAFSSLFGLLLAAIFKTKTTYKE